MIHSYRHRQITLVVEEINDRMTTNKNTTKGCVDTIKHRPMDTDTQKNRELMIKKGGIMSGIEYKLFKVHTIFLQASIIF